MNTDKNFVNSQVKREPSQRLDENNFNICSGRSLAGLKRQPDGLSLQRSKV